MSPSKNLTGQRFGRLVVIEQDGWYKRPSGGNLAKWKCVCDCGNIVNTPTTERLTNGKAQSCGCLQKERQKIASRKDPVKSAWTNYIRSYKQNAKERNLVWALCEEDIKNIAQQNCYYCDAPPRKNSNAKMRYINTCKRQNNPVDETFADSKIIFTNGIDRVDNTKGYVKENCVSCCFNCNISKLDKSVEQWEDWIVRLFANISRRKNK